MSYLVWGFDIYVTTIPLYSRPPLCIASSQNTFYVESMKMLSRNCMVCPLLRGGRRHTACRAVWWGTVISLSIQPMDFTESSLPFNACLQDAGINEAPRTFSQYLLPTTGSQYSDLYLLSFPYFSLFCEMGSCLDFIPTKLSLTWCPWVSISISLCPYP